MIWGEDDTFGRWVQGICGLVLLGIAVVVGWYNFQTTHDVFSTRTTRMSGGIAIGAFLLAMRCLWYAATGKNNVNRDDF